MVRSRISPPDRPPLSIAILGCGYVANMYAVSLGVHPELQLTAACDLDERRARAIVGNTGGRVYTDLDTMLADGDFELVLNLTHPAAHFDTTRRCLEAGKHVYSEKPLAMDISEAQMLASLADKSGLLLTSAPCTLMSPVAQTLWHELEIERIGRPRLVYAEMDDGMVHRMAVNRWVNERGVPWPVRDEFETGCTVEHAGYVLSWLVPMFGRVEEVCAAAACLVPDKLPGETIETADFTVAVLRHSSGVVSRLTNGIYAPKDHRLRVFGDEGVLTVVDPRCDDSALTRAGYIRIRRGRRLSPIARRLKLRGPPMPKLAYRGSQRRDFARAVADMADAIIHNRRPYLDTDLALHITEVTLAIQAGQPTYRPLSGVQSPGLLRP